uniref:Uncharacterized protein n=1 Tax=Caenorhabditis tropicalis TaxID=1561998 RepID=A0A1I7U557_9PELO
MPKAVQKIHKNRIRKNWTKKETIGKRKIPFLLESEAKLLQVEDWIWLGTAYWNHLKFLIEGDFTMNSISEEFRLLELSDFRRIIDDLMVVVRARPPPKKPSLLIQLLTPDPEDI